MLIQQSIKLTTFTLICLISNIRTVSSSVNPHSIDGRHSFSLTTFDPTGHLQQVESAIRASTLGVPVICAKYDGGIVFVSPHAHALPSPLIRDVGTLRITHICKNIVVAHSGVGADGRVLVAEAQRIAIEHAYTFDEDIPITSFLNQLALLYQKYTMKASVRPFGCALLVAHCGGDDSDHDCQIYQLDPSGALQLMDEGIGMIGKEGQLANRRDISALLRNPELNMSRDKVTSEIVSAMKRDDEMIDAMNLGNNNREKFTSFLVASLSFGGRLQLDVRD